MSEPSTSPEASPSPSAATTTIGRSRWWIHLLLVGSYPLTIGVLGWTRGESTQPALTHTAQGLIITCIVQMLIFGGVFGLAWLASRASRDDLLLRWRNGILTIPLGIAYSLGLRLALAVIAVMIGLLLLLTRIISVEQLQQLATANRPRVDTLVDISALTHNPLYFWLNLTLVSFVVAGFREELWRSAFVGGLRKLWPNQFGSRTGQVAAVAIAAIIFGLGHLPQGGVAVFLTGLLGFGLGMIMVFHQSIWPAVIAHGMFDATTFALLPWVAENFKPLQ